MNLMQILRRYTNKPRQTPERKAGASVWAQRRGDAKGELEQAEYRAIAVRQEARGPTGKLAHKHVRLKRVQGVEGRAFERAMSCLYGNA